MAAIKNHKGFEIWININIKIRSPNRLYITAATEADRACDRPQYPMSRKDISPIPSHPNTNLIPHIIKYTAINMEKMSNTSSNRFSPTYQVLKIIITRTTSTNINITIGNNTINNIGPITENDIIIPIIK